MSAPQQIKLTYVPCTECEPRPNDKRPNAPGRGRIEVPTISNHPTCGDEWIECPTCHGEGVLVVCTGCGETWHLKQLNQSIDIDGGRCDACPEESPKCAVCGSTLMSDKTCANCLVADEQSDYSEGQRLCDAQDDHFMQHYCPEYDGTEE